MPFSSSRFGRREDPVLPDLALPGCEFGMYPAPIPKHLVVMGKEQHAGIGDVWEFDTWMKTMLQKE